MKKIYILTVSPQVNRVRSDKVLSAESKVRLTVKAAKVRIAPGFKAETGAIVKIN